MIKREDLFEAGIHFGHKANLWNPKMRDYLFVVDNVHIINLDITVQAVREAMTKIASVVASSDNADEPVVLFVGTGAASEYAAMVAERSGQALVNYKWLGGMLTNHKSILNAIEKMEQLQRLLDSEQYRTKAEKIRIEHELERFSRCLAGVRKMKKLPKLVVVFSAKTDRLAIEEANKLKIPVVAICDSDSDPSLIDIVIPGNDDSDKAIALFSNYFTNAVFLGMKHMKASAHEAAPEPTPYHSNTQQ